MQPPDDIIEREQRLADGVREGGLRLTHQRLEIIRELARAADHPDAEELLRRVRVRVPTISLDTVCRTVAVLADRSLVRAVATRHATRFDPDCSPHHHFVCGRCGRLEDVEHHAVEVGAPPRLEGVGEIESVHLELRGVCLLCLKPSRT
jgi:Fur family peroxide stress response transcriptional regulator